MLILHTGNFSFCLLLKYAIICLSTSRASNQQTMYRVVHKLCYCFELSNNNYTFKFLMFLNNWIASGAQLPARNNKHALIQSRNFNLRLRSLHYSPAEKSLWVNKTLSKTEPWLHLSRRHKLSKNLASTGLMLIDFRLARYKRISWSQTRQSSSTPIPLIRMFICLFCTN